MTWLYIALSSQVNCSIYFIRVKLKIFTLNNSCYDLKFESELRNQHRIVVLWVSAQWAEHVL